MAGELDKPRLSRVRLLAVAASIALAAFVVGLGATFPDTWLGRGVTRLAGALGWREHPLRLCEKYLISKENLEKISRFRRVRVASAAMLPTLKRGDELLVAQVPASHRLDAGRIVLFRVRARSDQLYLRRVVARAGQSVEVRDGRLLIDGAMTTRDGPLPRPEITARGPDAPGAASKLYPGRECYDRASGRQRAARLHIEKLANGAAYNILECGDSEIGSDRMDKRLIEKDELFVIGDNRDNSFDSRFARIGLVARASVVGVAACLLPRPASDAPEQPPSRDAPADAQ